jgi:GntR family transcriptional regulator/MocR family aminotransferase
MLLSTSRHVLQSMVGCRGETWDGASKRLSGDAAAVGGDPLELRFLLPDEGNGWSDGEVVLAEEAAAAGVRAMLAAGMFGIDVALGRKPREEAPVVVAASTEPVDIDTDGLPPDAIPKGVDVVFTTARHQCPTKATMPLDRRLALLEAAGREGFVIVEDDYEFEMSFLKPVSPALKSLDTEGRVVYVGSFSKSVFPGMRLGYLVGPPSFIKAARALRLMMLRHPPGHIQRTMAYFLSLGHYDSLINRMRNAYRRRRQVMEEAILAHGLTVAGQGGFGGSSFWMKAPEAVDTEVLAERLRAEGVLLEPGRAFFDPARPVRNHYRLAYSSSTPVRIPDGVAKIASGIQRGLG